MLASPIFDILNDKGHFLGRLRFENEFSGRFTCFIYLHVLESRNQIILQDAGLKGKLPDGEFLIILKRKYVPHDDVFPITSVANQTQIRQRPFRRTQDTILSAQCVRQINH